MRDCCNFFHFLKDVESNMSVYLVQLRLQFIQNYVEMVLGNPFELSVAFYTENSDLIWTETFLYETRHWDKMGQQMNSTKIFFRGFESQQYQSKRNVFITLFVYKLLSVCICKRFRDCKYP